MKLRLPATCFLFLQVTVACAQYCGGGPTSTADSNVQSVQITGVSSSISHTGCPGVIGVQNVTSQNVNLNAGSNYNLYVQFGTCGGNYSGAGQAWIDFNHNYIFESVESIGTWSGTPPVAVSNFAFMVPAGANSGVTRMRISQQEGYGLPLDPCASFTWGSTMDFSVTISGGIDCSGYDGDILADAIPVTSLPYIDTNNTSVCYSNNSMVYNSPDVYYRFTTTAQAYDVHITTCNSSFDTYLSLLDKNGNVIGYNDDGGNCGQNSDILYMASGADTFYVVVEGWNVAMGEYILKIEENSGLGMSENEMVKPVVFPNPAAYEITFKNVPRLTMVYMFDVNGKMISTEVMRDRYIMNVSTVPDGMYLLEIIFPDESKWHHKLIIDRP